MNKYIFSYIFLFFSVPLLFSGVIDTNNKWGWSSTAGWIDHGSDYPVMVYSTHLEGYAYSSSLGWLKYGSYSEGGEYVYGNTGAGDYGVNNDGFGNLSGYAWSSAAGWINFSPENGGVVIDTLTGEFSGYAYSVAVGWINFNGTALDGSPYRVATTWRPPVSLCTLSYSAAAGGSVSGNVFQVINEGESGTEVEAVPGDGWSFTEWSDGKSDNPRQDISVTENISVTAGFEEKLVSIERFIPGNSPNERDGFCFMAGPVPQPEGCDFIDFVFRPEGRVEYSVEIYSVLGMKILSILPRISSGIEKRRVPVARLSVRSLVPGPYYALLRVQELKTGKLRYAELRFLVGQ